MNLIERTRRRTPTIGHTDNPFTHGYQVLYRSVLFAIFIGSIGVLVAGLISIQELQQSAQAVTDFSQGYDAGLKDGKANAAQNNNSTFNADTYTAANGECQAQGFSFSYCQGYKTGYHLGFGGIDKLFR